MRCGGGAVLVVGDADARIGSPGTATVPSCSVSRPAVQRDETSSIPPSRHGGMQVLRGGGPRHRNSPFRPRSSAKLMWVTTQPDDEDMPASTASCVDRRVVAIALTLLVLQLQVPTSPPLSEQPRFGEGVVARAQPDGSELTSYLVSFLVIAQFWMVHHRVLRGMRGHSEGLAWRNFGFLLALTLMPFTSDLIGRYGTNPLAITLFGLNLVAISLSTQWIFLYAASTTSSKTWRVRPVTSGPPGCG